MTRRGFWIYLSVGTVWLVFVAWQGMEHQRVREAARQALMSRGRDITSTLGLVIRSQRRFGTTVFQDRLQSALDDLIKPGELNSIALINAEGEVVVSAGAPLEGDALHAPTGVSWNRDGMVLANLIDLGTNTFPEAEGLPLAIVRSGGGGPRPPGGPGGTNQPPPNMRPPRPFDGPDGPDGPRGPDGTNATAGPPPGMGQGPGPGRNRGRPLGRPFGMSEEDYRALITKKGVHSCAIFMSTKAVQDATTHDLWLRVIIGLLASVSAAGVVFVWRNFERTADLELRLVKASEMNSHLKQMNLAAAGLAHETRNPLNIIRGLAQMISRQPDASTEVRDKSRGILEETDRVTAQLNEFINYSRPREVRRSPVAVNHVVGEVARALAYDADEKKIQLHVPEDVLVIQADEQLLRQALFNLLLNAIQAVPKGGEIKVVAVRISPTEAALEVRDTGPGVPVDRRGEIFKPYFTTNAEGTGLGLAVVRQIVLAHGWEIECLGNEPRGAVFRINRLRIAAA